MSDQQFVELCETLLRSDFGIDEDVYELLMSAAVERDNDAAISILLAADATDGMFYL